MDKRKAGDFFTELLNKARGVDDAYTARINKMYEGSNPAVRTAAVLAGGGHPSLRKGEVEHLVYGPETRMQRGARNAMEYALPAASAVPKYVLPAAGVTLAGKGLMDLAASFGGPADQQQSGELPITAGSIGIAALTGAAFAIPGKAYIGTDMDESGIPVNRMTEVDTRPFRM